MRKLILAVIAVLVLLAISKSFAFRIAGEDIKTKASWMTDFVSPENESVVTRHKLWTHFQKGDAGVGVRLFIIPRSDYLRLRVHLALKTGFITPMIGVATDSMGKDYISAGIQYSGKLIGKLRLFTDARNFWGLNGKATDFTDTIVALSWPINKRSFIGMDVVWDHYWDSGNDWFLVGVPIRHKLSDELTIFMRPSFDRSIPEESGSTDTIVLRIGFNYSF